MKAESRHLARQRPIPTPLPYAGATRIRFRGYLSARPLRAPLAAEHGKDRGVRGSRTSRHNIRDDFSVPGWQSGVNSRELALAMAEGSAQALGCGSLLLPQRMVGNGAIGAARALSFALSLSCLSPTHSRAAALLLSIQTLDRHLRFRRSYHIMKLLTGPPGPDASREESSHCAPVP
jgi:hypothetical protein